TTREQNGSRDRAFRFRRRRGLSKHNGKTASRVSAGDLDWRTPMNSLSTPSTHRWRAFALLAVAYFMTIIDLTIVNVSLPTIGRDLHFSETSLQWVVTAYALTFGGFLLLGGRAADLLGRRRILILGLALFTAASPRSAGGSTRPERSLALADWCCWSTQSPRHRSTAGAPRGRSRCSRHPWLCSPRSW